MQLGTFELDPLERVMKLLHNQSCNVSFVMQHIHSHASELCHRLSPVIQSLQQIEIDDRQIVDACSTRSRLQ